MNEIHPLALFRYSVLGSLISRAELPRGELKATIQALAARHYDIPGSRHSHLSEKTIEGWYYAWRRGGIEALGLGRYQVAAFASALALDASTRRRKEISSAMSSIMPSRKKTVA